MEQISFAFAPAASAFKKHDDEQVVNSRALKTHERHLLRRLKGDAELENILDWDFEQGCAYHVISGGDIDSLSYLKFILRQQPLKYCVMSTVFMAMADIDVLELYLTIGRIPMVGCVLGEFFKGL